jgi:hypothetical protein
MDESALDQAHSRKHGSDPESDASSQRRLVVPLRIDADHRWRTVGSDFSVYLRSADILSLCSSAIDAGIAI